jgi:hypothetical protein
MNRKCYISTTKINDNTYDRVEWDFLEAMLRKLSFNNGIVNLLMIKKISDDA